MIFFKKTGGFDMRKISTGLLPIIISIITIFIFSTPTSALRKDIKPKESTITSFETSEAIFKNSKSFYQTTTNYDIILRFRFSPLKKNIKNSSYIIKKSFQEEIRSVFLNIQNTYDEIFKIFLFIIKIITPTFYLSIIILLIFIK